MKDLWLNKVLLVNLKNLCIETDYVSDIGDYFETPNVETMAIRASYDTNTWPFGGVTRFVRTLRKLNTTKLRYLKLRGWSLDGVHFLLSDHSYFTEQVIQTPFCMHLTEREQFECKYTISSFRRDICWSDHIKIKIDHERIDGVDKDRADEIWNFCEKKTPIHHRAQCCASFTED